MIDPILRGKAWVCPDYVSTYSVIPQRRWGAGKLSEERLGPWALEDQVPEFKNKEWALRDSGCTIIVAGKGFGGGGKSVEHPIYALKGAGIQLVLADSFARYNFRNSINNGLPVFVCEGLQKAVATGDDLTVDMAKGFVVNERTGMRKALMPLAPFVLEILNAGGLLPYTRKQLGRV